MVELASTLIIASAYVGSLVAQQCAEGVVQAVWEKLKARFRDQVGRDPKPADLLTDSVRQLIGSTELPAELKKIYNDSSALRRVSRVRSVFRGASVLWCDDNPENNEWETALLRELGSRVTTVESNSEAVGAAKTSRFDLVLSDIDRLGEPEGLHLPQALAGITDAPVVFYVGMVDQAKGAPRGAFGITSHPAELLHLACDVLERTRL